MSASLTAYEQAIRALSNVTEGDYKRLAYEFAAMCPIEFLSAIDEEPEHDRKIVAVYMETKGLIPAIKECRLLMNLALKEAKEYTESLLTKKKLWSSGEPYSQNQR